MIHEREITFGNSFCQGIIDVMKKEAPQDPETPPGM